MNNLENVYKVFLEQMRDLEDFRMEYSSFFTNIPIEKEDPDVKRLIEAIGFFSARTHNAAICSMNNLLRRLFNQLLPHLLSPVPATAMIQASLMGVFTDIVYMPKGSEFSVISETEDVALFTTLSDLRIMPISISDVELLPLPEGKFRLLIKISSAFSRNDDLKLLSFYINHLNDFHSSLSIFQALSENTKNVSIFFDQRVTDETLGAECEYYFGLPESERNEENLHPLEKERLFFRLPEQELFFNVKVDSQPRNWRQVTIALDLDENWPNKIFLNKEIFQLFVVPIINLSRSFAQSILHDGTKEKYIISNTEKEQKLEVHSVLGVYKVEDKRMVSVTPGILSKTSSSYEIDCENKKKNYDDSIDLMQHWLVLYFPEAFERPTTVAVDALWYQPKFSNFLSQRLIVSPNHKSVFGLEWQLIDKIYPHSENDFMEGMDSFLKVLVLKNKKTFTLEDMKYFFYIFCPFNQSKFKCMELLTKINVNESQILHTESSGFIKKQIYDFYFKIIEPEVLPEIKLVLNHLTNCLNHWIHDVVVEIRIKNFEDD